MLVVVSAVAAAALEMVVLSCLAYFHQNVFIIGFMASLASD